MALSPCETTVALDGRELIQHGTKVFPIAFYNDNIKKMPVPWHWHDELEIGVITSGKVRFKIDTEEYLLSEGEGFFVNSGVLHEVWPCEGEEGELCSMVFHPELIGGSEGSVFWEKYLRPLMENTSFKELMLYPGSDWQQKIINNVLDAWNNGANEPNGYEIEVRNALSKVILLLINNNKNEWIRLSVKELREEARIKKMLQFIQENYQEEITTMQIAASASISESECLRCFKSTIKTTPIQFLKEYRLKKAATLLKTTQQKIVDIGILCGFQDMSYFAKAFRLVYGCTPSEYRDK